MKGVEDTMIEPIGAPSPLLKHMVTLSKQSQYSLSVPAPAATASHRRAPSRCSRIGGFCWRAQVEMARQSERGRMVPPSVFSRDMSRVGAKWLSSSRTACFFTSARVM